MTIVSAEVDGWGYVVRHVWDRDRACVFSAEARIPAGVERWTEPHECFGKWGDPVNWSNPRVDDGELDHVKEDRILGKKPPNDSAHLVLTCANLNQRVPSHEQREHERRVLAAHHPDVWRTFLERRSA